jgi:hypothetical protein
MGSGNSQVFPLHRTQIFKVRSTWRFRFIIKLHYINDCPLGTVAVINPFLHQHSNVLGSPLQERETVTFFSDVNLLHSKPDAVVGNG